MKTITSVVLIAALFLGACGANQVVTTLQLVVAASEAAVTTLEATGQINPATGAQITKYLTDVSAAASFAATELQSTDSAAVKATKIAQEFASIIAPSLPPGTAQSILAVIQAVTQAVANFLAAIQPAATVPGKITLSAGDRDKLTLINQRALALHAKLQSRAK